MREPCATVKKLYNIGTITKLEVSYRQTGVDTADTFVIISSKGHVVTGLWRTYRDYLNVEVDYNSVAELRKEYVKEVEDYKKFEKEHKADIAAFERLKKKLGR